MPAYFIAEVEVTNPEGYEPYRALAGASIAQYGGRFVVRGGKAELIEGGPEPKRVVVTEFADAAAARRWYNSPEYQAALPNSAGEFERSRVHRRRRLRPLGAPVSKSVTCCWHRIPSCNPASGRAKEGLFFRSRAYTDG